MNRVPVIEVKAPPKNITPMPLKKGPILSRSMPSKNPKTEPKSVKSKKTIVKISHRSQWEAMKAITPPLPLL